MKTAQFNKTYEIERNARGVKAAPRRPMPALPEVLTADKTVFDQESEYFFFDRGGETVRGTGGLRRVGTDYLGAMGLKIIAIADLYANRDNAIEAAQKYCLSEIEKLREKIRAFESDKSPKGRTLKYVLQAK